MPETGALYGLDQSQWVDERRSLTRSTTAAVAHLRDLYERFRRWDLALAAYNAGVENVLRGMAKAAAARPRGAPATPIGFAELAQQKLLPEETMNYVPQIVAFAIVANNRARFGLDAFHPDPPLELGEIAVPEGTRLRTIARAAGISTRLVREYNPEILRDRTPTYGGDYIIHLPGERIQQTLASFPAYLEHERVDDPNSDRPGDQATALAAPRIVGDEMDDDGEAPLPPRPSPIGKNRLPTFMLPGQSPSGLDMSSLGALGAKLPTVYVGGDVGWHPQTSGDPLAVLAANSGPAPVAAKGLSAAGIQKQLGIVATPTKASLEDPFEKFVLQNGVIVRLRTDASAPRIAITVRIAAEQTSSVVGVSDVGDQLGTGEVRHTITVSKRDMDLGFELAAGRLRLLLGEATGAPLASLRRLSVLPRRHALEQAPFGPAWLKLGDTLFPPGHPLEGRVLGAREDASVTRDLLLAESFATERSPNRATITVIGDVSRKRVQELCDRLLISMPTSAPMEVGMHPREERVIVEQNVPHPRALYGWIAPGEENVKMHAAMRVAMWILSSSKGGRLDRALVEKGYASEVKAHLDAGNHASVAIIDVMPAIPHDVAAIESRLDAEIDAFVDAGPTNVEIAYAVAHLKNGIKKEIASQKGEVAYNAPKYANSARIREAFDPGTTNAILAEYDKMSVQTMKQALRQTLARHHRVVVTTMPKSVGQ
jgi:predicted Zn-dependent peptidase